VHHGYFHLLGEPQIEDLWFGAVLFLQDRDPFGHDDPGDRVSGVLEVADAPCPKWAGIDTGGLHPFADPVVTEVALLRHMVDRMKEADAVRAPHDTVAATDAPGAVDEHHSIPRLIGGSNRADLYTGRVIALVTELWNEKRLGDIFVLNLLHAIIPRDIFLSVKPSRAPFGESIS